MLFRSELSLLYAMNYESTMTPIDFILRRTGILLFESEKVSEWKTLILDYMAEYHEWDAERKEKEAKDLDEMIDHITLAEFRN